MGHSGTREPATDREAAGISAASRSERRTGKVARERERGRGKRFVRRREGGYGEGGGGGSREFEARVLGVSEED